jgi:hypothetical protein
LYFIKRFSACYEGDQVCILPSGDSGNLNQTANHSYSGFLTRHMNIRYHFIFENLEDGKNKIETSEYGSELVSSRILMGLILEVRYRL